MHTCMRAKLFQLCPILRDPLYCSLGHLPHPSHSTPIILCYVSNSLGDGNGDQDRML